MSESYEAVLNHLLFHKALISESDGGERIGRYVAMVDEIERGMHVAVRDPFEKYVAAAFELVLEQQLNPWAISLAEFTRMYLEKVKEDGVVNFVTAGKLVFMAWSVLKMQSDAVLVSAEPAPPADDYVFADWDLDAYREPEDLDFNTAVLARDRLPLAEAIRREGRRAVTLMELVDAFDDARREAEIQIRLNALRAEARRRFAPNFHENVHSESLTEDIGLTWSRLAAFNGSAVPLRSLCQRDVWDRVTVFVSVLFLAKMQKLRLWQKEFPFGEIYVQRTAAEETISSEDLQNVPQPGPHEEAVA